MFELMTSGVRNHLSQLYRTLGVHSCQAAIKEAIARGCWRSRATVGCKDDHLGGR
jgi:DNA-binding NarL/FixJ family response regulator